MYKEIFAFARHKSASHKPLNQNKVSILMLGIDSISRLNLIRSMPNTYNYLKEKKWFQMFGYNKVEENTFPNLMAVLTGLDPNISHNLCFSKVPGTIEKNCTPIWMEFARKGYLTGYGEDLAQHTTFHNGQGGFIKQPTNYYMRPFTIAAETQFPDKKQSQKIEQTCIGNRMYAEFIFQYAIDFARINKNKPYFGLFWTNSFSHDTIAKPLLMDDKMVEYFKEMETLGILNETIVIFFSDHGMRYGFSRFSVSGFFEERLPFLFISIPPWLGEKHPEFATSLAANQHYLTTPYDLHLTLKQILYLNDTETVSTQLTSCPQCQSLLTTLPNNRSCEDAAIVPFWCTCPNPPFAIISSDEPLVQLAVQALMVWLNDVANEHVFCAQLTLASILSAQRSYDNYLITIKTLPGTGIFEAIMQFEPQSNTFKIIDTVSRLSWYMNESYCVHDDWLAKKVCYCRILPSKVTLLNVVIFFSIIAILAFIVVLIYKRIRPKYEAVLSVSSL